MTIGEKVATSRCRESRGGLSAALLSGTLALALLAGCGRSASSPRAATPLSVFAAASLTDAFSDLEREFESAREGAPVQVTFAGSQVLRLQIEQGAPADVFASADAGHMDALVRAGWVQGARVFTHNELTIVVPRSNPAGIESFADLARAQRLVLGAATVPVGIYTRELLARVGERFGAELATAIRARVVSEESNVRLLRAKVELGEADAAVVYRTDAESSERVRAVAIPAEVNVHADYYLGMVARSAHHDLARRWIDYVCSEAGRQVLGRHGFVSE